MLPRKNYYNYFDMLDFPFYKDREYMKTDIYEKDNKYVIEIDLPGLKKENIKINYENGYLTINANQDILKQTNDNYIRRERLYGEIRRSFFIGNKKEADIKALYKEGILTITFPKEEISKKSNKGINVE